MGKKCLIVTVVMGILLTVFCIGKTVDTCPESGVSEGVGVDRKPVIYLYPEEDDTEVSVTLDYDGNLVELDPEFNIDNGWKVTADRDGTITFEGEKYDYLYWEGDPRHNYNFFSGFCVRGEETEAFLKAKLTEIGLNEKEIAEFIEYWMPQMAGNEYNVISFQGSAYTKGAKLNIEPKPDTLIRVFMAWYPSDRYVLLNPQYLDEFNREGFTVVEWGGNRVK
jgi:hypothetical protein